MNKPRFNHLAIAVNVVLQGVLGLVWYGGLFEEAWQTHLARDLTLRNGPMPYLVAVVAALGMGYGLSLILQLAKVKSLLDALQLAFLVGVVFTVLPLMVHHAFAGFSWQLSAIDSGNRLLGILLATVLLTLWQPKAQVPVKAASVSKPARAKAA